MQQGQSSANQNANQVTNVNNISLTMAPPVMAAPNVIINDNAKGHSLVVRFLWYLFFGWWLSGLAIIFGWALICLVFTLPVGIALLHRVPQLQTLRSRSVQWTTTYQNGAMVMTRGTVAQHPFLLRAVYFLLIGWWWGAVWLVLAWALGLTIIGLPVSIWMIDRSPAMLTLQKH